MPARAQIRLNGFGLGQHGLFPVAALNRNDHHLIRRDARREDEPAVVAVRHDDAADHSRRNAPRGRPGVLQRLVAALELDLERFREVLPEVVRRAGLQRAAIAHERLDGIGARRAGKLLARALLPVEHGHREHLFRERLVDAEHPQRLFVRFGFGLVRGVALLPEEFGRAQERPRHLLPSDDVRPLVDEDRQIAPGLDPLRVHRADDGFRGRTDDQLLLELFRASFRHPGHLRREAFDMLGLAHDQALGNEQREVRVDVPGLLEAPIEILLNQLPDGVAVRTDDHAALDRRVVGQLRAPDDVQIPAGEILGLTGDLGDEIFRLFAHRFWATLAGRLAMRPYECRICRSRTPTIGGFLRRESSSVHRRCRGSRRGGGRRGFPRAGARRGR